MAGADIQGVYKEYIHPTLGETYEQVSALFGKIKKGKGTDVSDRASRFEFEVAPGGISGAANFDGGPVPVGDNNQVVESTVTTIGIDFSRSVTDKMDWATDNERKAIVKVQARLVRTALKELDTRMDIMLQGDGTGVAAIIKDTSTDTPPQYSVAIAGNPQATYWLREGEQYDIWNSGLTVQRANGPYVISRNGGILAETQDVTFTQTITGASASDRIVFQGFKNACFNGLAYLISDANTGTFQNLSRALPYVQARSVDAASAKLDWSLIRLSRNKIFKRMGEIPNTLVPYCGPEQQQNYEDAAQAISQIVRQSGPQKFDMMFDEGTVQGKKIMIDIHADPTRFYWLNFEDFIRLEMKKMDFLTTNGDYIYRLYGTPSGGIVGPIHQTGFTLVYQAQLALKRPPVFMSYIKNLQVPTGYITN